MMKLIRWLLGKIILTLDACFPPRATVVDRSAESQTRLDQLTSRMLLYQFKACPFCVKVRRAMKRLGLAIPLKDALPGTESAAELQRGGGSLQVPCLRIRNDDGSVRWLYESSDIIAYLTELASR